MTLPWFRGYNISIHALREEGDLLAGLFRVGFPFSIHALREEGDFSGRVSPSGSLIFLSTPSARRATLYLRKPLEGY